MFDTIIALFERLVVAHERLAASQEALLQNCACATTAEPPASEPEPQKEKKTRGKKKEEAPAPEPEAPVEEPATPEVVEAPVSHEEMKTAVKTYAAKHGREKAKALILEVGGAETLAEISDPDKVRALYLAAKEA